MIFQKQDKDSLLEQLSKRKTDRDAKPLILILGSGFSYGLVPTVSQFVEHVFPAYFRDQDGFYDALKKQEENYLTQYLDQIEPALAGAFWKDAYGKDSGKLSPESQLPRDYAAAYRDVFDIHQPNLGFSEHNQADQFLAKLIHANIRKLNTSHFMLASIIDLYAQKIIRSPLTEQIFTTNFDPFLQKALQLVNQLYLVTDTPDLEDALNKIKFTDGFINLVYVHGTHNRHMANTEADIAKQQQENAAALGKHFQQTGASILILGYGGWDDVLIQAICGSELGGNLHWCDRKSQEEFENSLTAQCSQLLQNSRIPRKTYTRIESADELMCELYAYLSDKKLPRLLQEPERVLIEQLEQLDLSEVHFPEKEVGRKIELSEVLEESKSRLSSCADNSRGVTSQSEDLLTELSLYEASKDWNGLFDFAEMHLQKNPESKQGSLLNFASGVALTHLERQEEACEKYAKAVEIKPDYHQAFNNWGYTLFDLKRYEEACEKYSKAVEIKPDKHEAFFNWGNALVELERYGDACGKYEKAVEINPDDHHAFFNWGNALSDLKRYEEACEKYAKAVEINPDDHHAFFNWGNALSDLKRYEEACEKYANAIKIKPDDHEAFHIWGNALSKLERYEEAVEKYTKALEIRPDDEHALFNTACVYGLMNNLEQCLQYLEKWSSTAANPTASTIASDSDFDQLRSEPRFIEFVSKLPL